MASPLRGKTWKISDVLFTKEAIKYVNIYKMSHSNRQQKVTLVAIPRFATEDFLEQWAYQPYAKDHHLYISNDIFVPFYVALPAVLNVKQLSHWPGYRWFSLLELPESVETGITRRQMMSRVHWFKSPLLRRWFTTIQFRNALCTKWVTKQMKNVVGERYLTHPKEEDQSSVILLEPSQVVPALNTLSSLGFEVSDKTTVPVGESDSILAMENAGHMGMFIWILYFFFMSFLVIYSEAKRMWSGYGEYVDNVRAIQARVREREEQERKRGGKGEKMDPGLMDDDRSLEEVLQEIRDITSTLLAENNVGEALSIAVRGLNLRKRYYGATSIEFHSGKVEVAQIVFEAASLHQTHKKYKEAAELLVHVDNLTNTACLQFPVINRSRLLLRMAMLKELMITRQLQARHRSALTFGRHFLELIKKLCLYSELPSAHLNLATVLSAMKLHEDALGHCYKAYQYTCRILTALDHPDTSPYIIASLRMSDADSSKNPKLGYRLYEQCLELQEEHEFHEANLDLSSIKAPSFNVEIPPEEHIWSLAYLWHAGVTDKKHVKHQFPCMELVTKMHSAMEKQKKKVNEDGVEESNPMDSRKIPLTDAHRRWGGLLALVFRNIAVEQEHLGQAAGALLTYKVAHTTALQCLGDVHPVTHQCEAAMKDAEDAMKHRESQRSYLKTHQALQRAEKIDAANKSGAVKRGGNKVGGLSSFSRPPATVAGQRANTPGLSQQKMMQPSRPQTVTSGEFSGNDEFFSDNEMNGASELIQALRRRRKARPVWNPWFNSKEAPPCHHTHIERPADFKVSNIKQRPQTTDPSGMMSSLFHSGTISRGVEKSSAASPSPIKRDEKSHVKHHQQPSEESYQHHRDLDIQNLQAQEAEMERDLLPADYQFLAATYKLRHDPKMASFKPYSVPPRTRGPVDHDPETRALKAEKRLAKALAVEMGINTE